MKTYRTAKAFRMALEARLKQKSRTQEFDYDF